MAAAAPADRSSSSSIYASVDLSGFAFTPRAAPFDWRLLHGLDVDELVRLNDTARLEAAIPALQQGSVDAEHALTAANYVQLFRLVQLAVEHLWQMRESHARLFPAYVAAADAAQSWKAAAGAYLDVGSRLLSGQGEAGAVITEALLSEVAVAREALEKADAAYNAALDKLEGEDAAARCHSLRRQRLEISWRLVFGLDVQHLLITGSVSRLEALLPQVAYGNLMAESPAGLTPAHFRQLLLLGQACLDYLHAICQATSRALEAEVQQLACGSRSISELTSSCEELRAALAGTLSSSLSLLKASSAAAVPARGTIRATATATAGAPAPGSPTCHAVAHVSAAAAPGCASCSCCSAGSPRCQAQASSHWCCHSDAAELRGSCCGMLSGRLWDMGLAPAADRLQTRINKLDSDLRDERERTAGMRRAVEEVTAMLQQLPDTGGARQQQPRQPKQRQQLPQQQQQAHHVHVPVTISLADREGARRGESTPASPGSARADSPNGAVRVLINEDAIRARERSAAGQQLSAHINDILLGARSHERSSGFSQQQGGSGISSISSPGGRAKPLLSFKSIPSGVHAGPWPANDGHPQPGQGFFGGDSGSSAGGGFMSGPVRGWPAAGGEATMRQAMLMQQQQQHWQQVLLQQQQQEEQWPLEPTSAAGPARGGSVAAALQQHAPVVDAGAQAAAASAEVAALRAAGLVPPAPTDAGGDAASSRAAATDPSKQHQQALFREAAAGGFRKLLRSVSPKRMFAAGGSPQPAVSGRLQWPQPQQSGTCSRPDGGSPSPTRSASSFTARAAAKAAEALQPQTPAGEFSPLKASILAHTS